VAQNDHVSPLPLRTAAGRLHLGSLVGAAIFLAFLGGQQWFWSDDWSLIGLGTSPLNSLIQPLSGHWIATATTLHVLTYSIFGLRTYLPYMVLTIVAHIALAHMLWRTVVRSGVSQMVATLALLPFLVMGAGWGVLLWQESLHFIIAIALGYALFLLNDTKSMSPRRSAAAMIVSLLAVASLEIGVVMVALSGLIVWWRAGFHNAVRRAVPPLLVYLIWLAVSGSAGFDNPGRVRGSELLQAPDFIWSAGVGAVDAYVVVPVIGAIALVLLSLWALRSSRKLTSKGSAPVLAAAISALAFGGLVCIARLNGGVPWTSYYVYPLAALLFPACVLALVKLTGLIRLPVLAIVLPIGIASAVHGSWLLTSTASSWAQLRQESRNAMDLAAWTADPRALGQAQIDPVGAPGLTLDVVRTAARRGEMEQLQQTTAAERRIEAARWHVLLLPSRPQLATTLPQSPALVRISGTTRTLNSGSCVTLGSPEQRALITTSSSTIVEIKPRGETAPLVSLDDGEDGPDQLVSILMAPWQPGFLAISAPGVTVSITSTGSDLSLCGKSA
jgi:hypothetical protein